MTDEIKKDIVPVYAFGKNPAGFVLRELILTPEKIELTHYQSDDISKFKMSWSGGGLDSKIVIEKKDGTIVDLTKELNIQSIEFKVAVDDLVTEIKIIHALW